MKITRRGDVIPKIIENLGPSSQSDLQGRFHADGTAFSGQVSSNPIQIPADCPACDRPLSMEGAFLRCSALECDARTARALTYWCRTLEMDGIGEKLIEALLDEGLVKSIADLYRLTHSQITQLDRMGDKSAYNVLDELAKTKSLNLSKFLHALGIERIGPEVATTISQHFSSLDKLLVWIDEGEIEELTVIDGIGDKVANIFREGISKRRLLIEELSNIISIQNEAKAASGILDGKSFCITGSMTKPRKEIALAIKNAGGKVVGSVSANLDVLIAGEKAGSKLAKAQSLGLEIWAESDLFTKIAEPKKGPKTLFDYDQ